MRVMLLFIIHSNLKIGVQDKTPFRIVSSWKRIGDLYCSKDEEIMEQNNNNNKVRRLQKCPAS